MSILFTSPIQQTAKPDGTFDLTIFISTTEPVTGLDWTLDLTNCQLLSRDLSNTPFSDPISNTLTGDFGASLQDVSAALSAPGTYEVMRGSFRVENPANFALVSPTSYLDLPGVVMGPPNFSETTFTAFQGSQIVVPEPTTFFCGVFLLLVFYLIFGGRR